MIEVLFWDYIPLTVMMLDPAAVIYDRPPILVLLPGGEHTLDDATNPSLLALPPEHLKVALERRNVRIVVAYSDRAIANLSRIARRTEHSERFSVFLIGS